MPKHYMLTKFRSLRYTYKVNDELNSAVDNNNRTDVPCVTETWQDDNIATETVPTAIMQAIDVVSRAAHTINH